MSFVVFKLTVRVYHPYSWLEIQWLVRSANKSPPTTLSPYALPLKTFRHPPFFGRLTLGRAMRMTGGAALQPVSTAPSLPSLPGTPASPPRAYRGGHTLKANGRPPSEDFPPSADARAPFLSEWDTAGCLDAPSKFSHAGPKFSRHGTTMTIQEPS